MSRFLIERLPGALLSMLVSMATMPVLGATPAVGTFETVAELPIRPDNPLHRTSAFTGSEDSINQRR